MARILIVDDEPGIREFLGEALADDDHDITVAADGEAAWDRLGRESFELVLTDLRLPGPASSGWTISWPTWSGPPGGRATW